MEFDLLDGAKSLSLSYAKYGKDKNSQFEVYYSTNSGASWQLAGSIVTVNNSSLQQISTWKVILVLPSGNDDVNRVTTNTLVIAIDMPNDQTVT